VAPIDPPSPGLPTAMSLFRRIAHARLRVLALTSTLLLIASVGSALAWRNAARSAAMFAEVVAYGPSQTTTPTGASTNRVEQFTLAAAAAGNRYLLKVENGSSGGTLRATSGSVVLNGATVVTSAELTAIAAGASLRKPIFIKTTVSNTLSTTVAGVAGSYATVSIVAAPDSTFTLFTKTYQRANGQAVTVTDQFTLPAGAGVPRFLYVTNGNGDGTATSSSASVVLNGVEVVGSANLNGTVQGFVVPVTLQQTNTVATRLMGTVGSKLTLRFAATDSGKPVLTVTAPAVGLVTKLSSVTATGTVTDQTAVGVTVTAPGQSVAATLTTSNGSTSYSAPINLTEGSNAITIRAVDGAGNTTDSTRTVIRDTQAPTVQITSLPDTTKVTPDSTVVVAGTILDATRVTANLNGVAVPIDSVSHAFSRTVTLAAGTNFLTLVATDAAGNATTVVRQVTRETVPPSLTLTAPAESLYTKVATVRVAGSFSGGTNTKVTVTGTSGWTVVSSGSTFFADVGLVEGINLITVAAKSASGAQATRTRTTFLDTQAPVLTVAGPAEGLVTKLGSIPVTGTLSDQSRTTLTMTVGSAVSSSNGDARGSISLQPTLQGEGPITISLKAEDAAGNVTVVDRHIVRDVTVPTIVLTAPAAGAMSRTAAYHVTGTVSDATALTVTVNGTATTLGAGGAFDAVVTLDNGANGITVMATDAAGNQGQATGSVLLDAAPPVLTLSSPAVTLTVTNSATVTVTGTATDQTGASVLVNGMAATLDGAGAFSVPVTLAEGANTVTILVTDGAGNTTTVLRPIDLDTQAPTLDVASPQNGAIASGSTVDVSGTATDGHAVTVAANGTALTVGSGGTFSGTIAMPADRVITVTATDAAGNVATVTRTLAEAPTGGGLPPDPASVAPALDQTSPSTSIATATAFLYTGSNPIQTGVAPGTIVAQRAAVMRGGVRTRAGAPLPGVRVSVLDHPELGQTLSRADGMYDLAVNGGGLLTLTFEKSGSFTAQRQVQVPWQDYVVIDDAVLVSHDSVVTPITLGGTTTQVARGSMSTDARGSRQATMVFAPGTTASLVMPDGSMTPVGAINVRATEYTVGPSGPSAMPAVLPPTSAYTYAVELSADEAIAAGANGVQFNQDVAVYIDNFLGVPAGTAVPVGFYDRQRGAWVPQANGIVLAILGVTDGMATLDVDGDGAVDPASTLALFGITDAERARLAQLYAPGKTLTRFATRHFSPFDCNYASQLPKPAWGPKKPKKKRKRDEAPCEVGSIIDCGNQALGEVISLSGTPFSLRYRSDRMPGYTAGRELTIPLSDSVAPSLKRIEVRVAVGGRVTTDTFLPAPNLTYQFRWDGKDAYGRELAGDWPVDITVSNVYPLEYVWPQWTCVNNRLGPEAQVFGLGGQECQLAGGGSLPPILKTSAPLSAELRTYMATYPPLGSAASRMKGIGGWTLDVHHAYDPAARMLFKGDGTQRSAEQMARVTTTAAGSGAEGHSGDGGAAVNAQLTSPQPIAVGADGTVYVAEWRGTNIRRIAPNGVITLFAGGYGSGALVTTQPDAGDGGPATSAKFKHIQDLATGPDGAVYVADEAVVRRIEPDGIITTVAGAYGRAAAPATGDGGLATAAAFTDISGVDVGPDGSVYIADGNFTRPGVRKVSPSGVLMTIAGGLQYAANGPCNADGIPAAAACLTGLLRVRVGPDGSIYLLEGIRIRRVSPDGMIHLVAGNPTPSAGTFSDSLVIGEPAIGPRRRVQGYYMDVAADGSVYTNDTDRPRVLRIGTDGIVTSLAGNSMLRSGFDNNLEVRDGASATAEPIDSYAGIAAAPDGSVYLADPTTLRVHHISAPLPGIGASEFFVASEDGTARYVFSAAGRHLRTLSTLTGQTALSFGYGSDGQLVTVTDRNGLTTRINRDASGNVTSVAGPYGERTQIVVGSDGLLSNVINAAADTITLAYAPGGLLARLVEATGGVHTFSYASNGRLLRDAQPGGSFKDLSRVDEDSMTTSTITDALGHQRTYTVEDLSTGGQRMSTTANRLTTTTVRQPDGTTIVTTPDGTVTTSKSGPSPRFGMQAELLTAVTMQTPGGITSSVTTSRHSVLADAADPSSVTSETDSVSVNGRIFVTEHDVAARRITTTSAEGRISTVLLDEDGRVLRRETPETAPVVNAYDTAGHLITSSQRSRTWAYTYGIDGRLATTTDPLLRTLTRFRDSTGRLTRQKLPDGREIAYGRDRSGRIVTITTPAGATHGFGYDSAGFVVKATSAPTAGGVATTTYEYGLTGDLARTFHPDSSVVEVAFDTLGRQTALVTPSGQFGVVYAPTGQPKVLTAPGDVTLTYTYDGPRVTKAEWTGPVQGAVGLSYNVDRQVAGISVGGQGVAYDYDLDGLIRAAGALSIARSQASGRISAVTLGGVATQFGYNDLGEVTGLSVAGPPGTLMNSIYTRDAVGRISELRETVAGVTQTISYDYDLGGRLTGVLIDGVAVASYEYDGNGNRTRITDSRGSSVGQYDQNDQLNQMGNVNFLYTGRGILAARIQGTDTTRYRYDALGNLREVTRADGRRVTYIVDAKGRRIGKQVDGVLVQGFLYQTQVAPVAELDANNAVVSRFVYATFDNVPDYMVKGGVAYRLVTDHLGSVRLVVNAATGIVAQRIDYDALGRVISNTNPGFQPFGFAGGLYDEDTQLTHFNARDYDASTGRWTAPDPEGFGGGPNLYTYAGNDPVNVSDPSGRCPTENGGYAPNGDEILTAAEESGEWTYSQGPGKGDPPQYLDAPGPGGEYVGDCTDYVRYAVSQALGDEWSSKNPAKANTKMYKEHTAEGFEEIDPSEARAGDIVVKGGHAGIYVCTDKQCRVWGLANNGSPSSSGEYKNSSTGVRNLSSDSYGAGAPRFFRPVNPLAPAQP
jgi:RHS repeat-associated protein